MHSSLRAWTAAAGALTILVALPGSADVKQVRLGVKGATCATCAFSLRKGFQRMDGVEEAKLTVKPAFMHIRMKPGQWPDLVRMQRTIKDAGFTPVSTQVELVLTGKIVRHESSLALEVDGMETPVNLVLHQEGRKASLDQYVDQSVELEGRWQPPARGGDGAGTLAVMTARTPGKK